MQIVNAASLPNSAIGVFAAQSAVGKLSRRLCILSFVLAGGFCASNVSSAPAPSVMYSPYYIGVNVFGVDSQTNAYANQGGKVFRFNSACVPYQTNNVCPVPGIARRDAAGNIYFAGTFAPPVDFGGVTLTNNKCYLAKYSDAGGLIWAVSYEGGCGTQQKALHVDDLQVDEDGSAYVSYVSVCSTLDFSPVAIKYNADGAPLWSVPVPRATAFGATGAKTRIALMSPLNGYAITYTGSGHDVAALSTFDTNGAMAAVKTWSAPFSLATSSRPIVNSFSDVYNVEQPNGSPPYLAKTRYGSWTSQGFPLPGSGLYTVGTDRYDGAHVCDTSGNLSRCDIAGNVVWTVSLPAPVGEMVQDNFGNRFFSLTTGAMGRLGDETLVGTAITTNPVGKTVFTGTNFSLAVGASGTTPLRYFWFKGTNQVPGGTNATLNFINPSASQSGSYSVIVSNLVGSVTSAPVQVRIKAVAVFNGGQFLTNGTYTYISPPTLSIYSAFTNGGNYYTLTGSPPTFESTFYTGPFILTNSALVRAIGYSADFSQSEEAESPNIIVVPPRTLTATTAGGGTVSLNPPGGTYQPNSIVTATATNNPGWSFLYWTGDVYSSSPSVNVTMDSDKSIQAVFGTALSATASSGGQVQKYPGGPLYAYGSAVRLSAIPDSGYHFAVWGNAGSGSANPLYFRVTNANQTVSSAFAQNAAGQAALTILINGPGTVDVNPPGNYFATNQTVSVTATPLTGQGFINWTGDLTGTQNPLSVAMTQNQIITANFTNWPTLVAPPGSMTPQGFQFTVLSGPGNSYMMQGSYNLFSWVNLGVVTNTSGQSQFTDPAGTNFSRRFYRGVSWP